MRGKRKIEVHSEDELIEILSLRLSENRRQNKEAKPSDVLWAFVIGEKERINVPQLFDERTEQLYDMYWFYKNDPSKINNIVWYEAVKRLNKIYDLNRN